MIILDQLFLIQIINNKYMAIELSAIKIGQKTSKDKGIYLVSVPVKYLVDEKYFKIDWWETAKLGQRKQGYQRKPAEGRVKKIAKFLDKLKNPVFPTSILINSREHVLDFKKSDNNVGNLTIEPFPNYIVDGQTRVEGFKYAINDLGLDLGDYELPVTFLSNFDLGEELEQFYVLNTTQKKVSTDLAQRLKMDLHLKDEAKFEALAGGERWELLALKLVDQLNSNSAHPIWSGRIRLPNTQKSRIDLVNQNSFVQSLKPLFKDGPLDGVKPERAYEIMRDYWDALSRIFPDAFNAPKDYVIQKTPGLFSLHDLAKSVFNKLNAEEKKINVQNLVGILSSVFSTEKSRERSGNSDSDWSKDWFWHKDNDVFGAARAGSMKGFSRLAQEFKDSLN